MHEPLKDFYSCPDLLFFTKIQCQMLWSNMELYVVIYFVTSCIQDNEQRLLYSFNRSGYMDRSVLGVELILQTNKLSMSTKMIFRPVLLFLSNFNERRSSNSFSDIYTYNWIIVIGLSQVFLTRKNNSIYLTFYYSALPLWPHTSQKKSCLMERI